jgi:AsmA protein
MKRAVRYILLAAAVLIVLLLVLPFLIPVNQFRPKIESEASAAVGRKVEIGNLRLSLIRGSLSAENLSIADDPKFGSSPFLTAKSLYVGVELMPLILSRTLNVTSIVIEEPQVTLLRNPAGQWNFSTLSGAANKKDPPAAATAKSNSASSSGTASLSVKSLELKNGKLIVGSTASKKRSIYDNVTVTATGFSMTSKFPITLSADLPGGGKLSLDGTAGPIDQADAALTPLEAKLHVTSLNLASTGFLDPSLGLGGLVDMDSTIASQNGLASTKGSLKLSKALLVQGGSPAGVPATVDFNTRYDLRKEAGVINPSTVKIGAATARLNGTYASQGDDTVVDVKLVGENMPAKDLQDFLPAIGVHVPQGASLTAGTLNANLNIKGPTDRLVTDGTLGLDNGRLSGFNLGSKMSAISALTGLSTGSDLIIEKLSTNVHMAPNGLRAENFNAVVPSLGTLIGAGTVDARNNLDFKMVAKLNGPAPGGTGAAGVAGALGGLLGQVSGGGKSGGGTAIPFLIQGTTSDPKFVPDVSGLTKEMLKSQLGSLNAPAPSGAQQQNQQQNPLGALGGLFKKKKP